MKTSDSAASSYCGRPLSVLRVIAGSERLQPKPNAPLPDPESYESDNCGPKPDRPGLVAIGTDIEPVPLARLTPNFSPRPLIAPPPLGSVNAGALGPSAAIGARRLRSDYINESAKAGAMRFGSRAAELSKGSRLVGVIT